MKGTGAEFSLFASTPFNTGNSRAILNLSNKLIQYLINNNNNFKKN